MKNVIKLAVGLIAITAIVACGGAKDTPEAVAEKYLNHLNKQEWDDAKKLSTEETGQMIDMMKSLAPMGGDDTKKETKIENLKCETKESDAACSYTTDGKEEKLNLVKKDGKWLVHMPKETPTDTDTPPVDDSTATNDTPPAEGE